ncbi:MAG TPA: GAF domain-containing protein, partial [Anaerolineae bacterium]|nr:GAF domain-containing protein [Anaerolineae bacterium]
RLVPDVQADPRWYTAPDVATGFQTRSILCVPLISRGRPIGVLEIINKKGGATFDRADQAMLATFALQAAIAVENARLYESTDEALKKQLREMAAIEEIDHELGATLDMERIINLVLQRALEACNAISGVIGILSPDGQVLDTLFWQGLHPENIDELTRRGWPADRGVIGRVIRSGQPALIADVREDPDYVAVVETSRSEIAVPIVREDRVIGVLNLESDQPAAFTEDDLRFIQHLADHASIAIENARLFQEQRRRVQMLSAIGEIGREIVASLDLDRTLHLILERVQDLVGYYAAEICLWDEADQLVVTYASAGDTRYTARTGGFYRLDEGFTGWIARHRRELIIPDIAARQDIRPKIWADDVPLHSYVGLPLQTAESFIGTLEIIGDQPNLYTDDQIEALRIIADQAAAAIQNARLYEETQRRFEYTQRLLRVSKTIGSTLDLTETVRNVAREMCRALGADMAGVYLADEDGRFMRAVAGYHVPKEKLDFYRDFRVPIVGHPFVEEAWRTRQAVYSLDPVHDPRLNPEVVAAFPNKTTLFAPMVSHDEVIGGVYLIWTQEKRSFDEEELQLANAIAWQAGVVVENARLYERTDERLQAHLDELTALQRITQQLNATLNLDAILHTVLEAAIQTTGATHGNVMLLDMDTGQLTLRVAQGYTQEEMETIRQSLAQLAEDSLTHQVVSSGEPRLVRDARQETYTVCVKEETLSALAVPIIYQQDVVGVIHLRHLEANAFNRETQTFVQSLAQQASIAIGNAMRFEEQVRSNNALRRRTEQMDRLLTISQKLRTDIPLEDALEEVAYAIQETAGFNVVLISITEGGDGSPLVLRRVASAGLPLREFEELVRVRQPVERYERILREEYRQGNCYFFPFDRREDWGTDLHTHTPMPEIESWQEGQWHPQDMLLVPLRGSGGRLVGLISVDDPQDGRRPSRRILDLLAIFGNQAAVAIENANLYRDARRRADNLALINEIGRRLSHALEPRQVLDTVVQGVPMLLNCDVSAIFQPDPRDGSLKVAAAYGLDPAQIDTWQFPPGEGRVGQVAVGGEPLLIPDVSQAEAEMPCAEGYGSVLLVPIAVGRRVLGVLLAAQRRKHALNQTDQILLSTLADQAAVALESARLFESTQKAAIRLSLLNEIGRRAASQLEPQELLDTTVRDLHQNLGYFRVAVFLIDEHSQELYAAAANDLFWPAIPSGYRQKVGAGLIGAAAASGETVLVNDTAADDRFLRVENWTAPASLSVPIKVGEQVIGVLHAEAEEAWAFDEEDAAALEMAADQLAVALENARLFQETRRRVAELATVNEIGQALSRTLDAENLAELIYTHVGSLLDTRNFFIALYDEQADLIRVDFRVERGERQPPIALRPGEGLTSYLIKTGQPILLRHGTEAFHEEHGLVPYGPPARSWLGVPMLVEGQVVGAIVVQSYEQEAAYDEGHLRLLSTIAGQATIALQNAQLFGDRERRINELAVLNEMAQAISSALDLDTLLKTVYDQVSRLFDTTNFYIATYQEGDEEWTLAFCREHGEPIPTARYSIYQGLTGHIIRTRQALLFRSMEETARFHQEQGIPVLGEQSKSWMGVPLITADQVVGVIGVQSYQEEYLYGQEDLDILTTIAAQVAVAMRNAQLYRQLRDFSSELEARVEERTRDLEEALAQLTAERDRAETLYRITSELGATLDLERVLEHALHLFADALEVEHGTIMLLDQESGYLTLQAVLGPEEEQARRGSRTPFKRGVGLAGWILEHRKPVLIPDVTQDPRWIPTEDHPLAIRSAVAAPLSLGGGDIMGVLTLGHPEVGHFTEEHLQLVIAAAAQIAVAVNNSDLYAYITEQADQLGSMLQSQQEEAAKNRAILESIADGVLVLDHNGKVLLINPAAEELLGVSAMAIEGEHFRHMLGLGETSAQRELARSLYSELRRCLER